MVTPSHIVQVSLQLLLQLSREINRSNQNYFFILQFLQGLCITLSLALSQLVDLATCCLPIIFFYSLNLSRDQTR